MTNYLKLFINSVVSTERYLPLFRHFSAQNSADTSEVPYWRCSMYFRNGFPSSSLSSNYFLLTTLLVVIPSCGDIMWVFTQIPCIMVTDIRTARNRLKGIAVHYYLVIQMDVVVLRISR